MEADKGFLDYFNELEDPRIERCKLYPMEEILLLALCGMICGSEGFDDLELFGETKLEFLRRYLPYAKGTPSDDTIRRFFRALDYKRFQSCFVAWVNSLSVELGAGVIAIDGKTSRHSFDGEKKALHVISAFASEARLVLAQEKVSEKSNEITAIPELLRWLDLRGALVSIDAMGCQTEIAHQIKELGGDYLLALKGNQSSLHEDVKIYFEAELKKEHPNIAIERHETIDKGHGRIDTRQCFSTGQIDWLKQRHPQWLSLNSIICIRSTRELKNKVTLEYRYYLSSMPCNAVKALAATRSHWAVENSLHWVLDMSFGDDQSRIRKDNAPMNMAIVKHATLNLINKFKPPRQTIKRLRKLAGWDDNVLSSIIAQKL